MRRFLTLGLTLATAFSTAFAPRLTAAASAAEQTPAVLDEYSYWREFQMFRPPILAEKAEGAVVPEGEPRTAAPAAGWTAVDFDDGRWARLTGPVFPGEGGNGYGVAGAIQCQNVGLACLRGKFSVEDPAKVTELKLSAVFRGGMVVYLNGAEVARCHLPKGELTVETPAEEYPWDAYVAADGRTPLDPGDARKSDAVRQRLEARLRRLDGVALPLKELKKGVNVLAIELHRSPEHPKAPSLKDYWKYVWAPIGLQELRLTAAPDGAVQPNTQRPRGLQVWNENPIADVYDVDYGDPNEPLRPVELVGVRNGSFSGQVVVGSDAPLKGLSAAVGELKSKDGKLVIAADRVRLTYPLPTGNGQQNSRARRGMAYARTQRFDALAEAPPAEVPLATVKADKGYTGLPLVPGAVQPVRVTVRVPAEAEAGDYEGTLTLKAEGLAETAVAVRIRVIGWTLPDPREFTSHLGIAQSAETLSIHYNVPMWSDEHWKLIDRSFALLGHAGVDELYLPMVMKFHWGKHSLVRWVKSDDGSFSYDYSIFEKYVDTALKHLGRPEIVCLYVWDRKYRCAERTDRTSAKAKEKLEKFLKEGPPHPLVPLLDPKTGTVTEMEAPPYSDEKSAEFWKPVLDGCRERLLKRGIAEEAVVIGVVPDGSPTPEAVDNFYAAAPWAKWEQISHAPGTRFKGVKVKEVPVYYAAGVYGGTPRLLDPAEKRSYGWKPCQSHPTDLFCVFPRAGAPYMLREETSGPAYHTFMETYLMTGLRGAGRLGAEFWPVSVEKETGSGGETLISTYSINTPSMVLAVHDLLAPGPEGALSTVRLENLYEGSQEGQARVFLEKALEAGSVDQANAAAVQELLDRRQRMIRAYQWGSRPVMIPWYEGSGWQGCAEELYRAAASVKTAAK